ncbi:Gmad2 immunoglobulin-like domain-containing protein [Actinoplanes sp. NPDC049599]|uniref:Gmad2 immunoglobulin-like domain-containing protein n=1 Tax=Actinoplanes sp. NPDC049599 TaxID=3363903 RepID=UPI003787DCA0
MLDATTETIRVDRPRSAISPDEPARITSPVTVTGAALTFEGVVTVRVVQVTGTTVRQLGTGSVVGGGDVLRPFTGSVSFTAPGSGTGWVLAGERSALNGSVTKVTAIRVAFG